MGLRWLARGKEANAGIPTVAMGNILACLCALPMALPVRSATAVDVGVILYLGAVQIGLAYLLLTRGLKHVPVFEATTLLITEPALNPVWTWLVHGERPARMVDRGRRGDPVGYPVSHLAAAQKVLNHIPAGGNTTPRRLKRATNEEDAGWKPRKSFCGAEL